jgi:NAD(P)H-hydrate repair Nnr-like enzyme with NAD(P)H-hydrate dehydratase domain
MSRRSKLARATGADLNHVKSELAYRSAILQTILDDNVASVKSIDAHDKRIHAFVVRPGPGRQHLLF